MTVSENISPELIASYRATHFHVIRSEQNFTLHVDVYSAELDELQNKHDKYSSAFITACNPQSKILTLSQNAKRHIELRKDLENYSCIIFDGFGEDPEGQWDSEESYLALGILEEDASQLGIKYGQNAILYSKDDAIPKLILLK